MNNGPQYPGAGLARNQEAKPRGYLKPLLLLLNGFLIGVLVFGLVSRHRDQKRQSLAQSEIATLFGRVVSKVEQQASTVSLSSDELKNDLVYANMATSPSDIRLGLLRPKAKQIKNQLDQSEAVLRQFAEDSLKTIRQNKVHSDKEMLTQEQQQKLDALARKLDDCWQDLGMIESQLDWVAMRWSQLVMKEAEESKQIQVQKAHSATEDALKKLAEYKQQTALQAQTVYLADALQRSQAETERARTETLRASIPNAFPQIQPAYAVSYPVYPSYPSYAPCPPPPVHYFPSTRYNRNYRQRGGIISYGCRYPNYHRFGSYLVIN